MNFNLTNFYNRCLNKDFNITNCYNIFLSSHLNIQYIILTIIFIMYISYISWYILFKLIFSNEEDSSTETDTDSSIEESYSNSVESKEVIDLTEESYSEESVKEIIDLTQEESIADRVKLRNRAKKVDYNENSLFYKKKDLDEDLKNVIFVIELINKKKSNPYKLIKIGYTKLKLKNKINKIKNTLNNQYTINIIHIYKSNKDIQKHIINIFTKIYKTIKITYNNKDEIKKIFKIENNNFEIIKNKKYINMLKIINIIIKKNNN